MYNSDYYLNKVYNNTNDFLFLFFWAFSITIITQQLHTVHTIIDSDNSNDNQYFIKKNNWVLVKIVLKVNRIVDTETGYVYGLL